MKKKHIIVGSVLVLLLVIIGSTLSLWTWSSPNTPLTLEVGEMTDVIFEEGNDIVANNMGPVLNYEDGEITKFAIINNSTEEQFVKFYLDISEISDSLKEESFKYILQTSTNGTNYVTYKEGNLASATTGKFIILDSEILPRGTTYYRFIIYIDGNMENPSSMMNNSLKATFNVEAFLRPITGEELGKQIALKSNGVKDTVNDIATTDEGIWETQDDYGTTYYFRGAVENNYVKFAGFYWRIVRINGDGSIRLIYDGTSAHANGESSDDRQIGTSLYNTGANDNAYFGYMYGTPDSGTYEETHANINDSTIKKAVDNWYKENIADKGYGDYIADAIYCNDRKLYTGTPWLDHGTLGYGKNNTVYDITARHSTELNVIKDVIDVKISCSQQNDRFTVDDTTNGNGALTYPVGLITSDEIFAAGGFICHNADFNNSKYYIYTGTFFWTMSPSVYSGNAYVIGHGQGGRGHLAIALLGVRPVISLKTSVEFTGSGTMDDPYEVIS